MLIWTWRVRDLGDILTLYRRGWATRAQHGFSGKKVVGLASVVSFTLASSQPCLRPSMFQRCLLLIEPGLGSLPAIELRQACEGG